MRAARRRHRGQPARAARDRRPARADGAAAQGAGEARGHPRAGRAVRGTREGAHVGAADHLSQQQWRHGQPVRRRVQARARQGAQPQPRHRAAGRAFHDAPARRRLGTMTRLARFGALLALLALWQLLSLRGLPDYVLSPLEIAKHFFAALGTRELYQDAAASLLRALPGFAIGTLLGIALGLAAGIARSFDEMPSPLVFLTYPVPKIVMLPVFMLWFGIGDLSKVLIIALACFYPAFINAYYGARATRRILVWSARNMGASEAEIFRRVVLPGALPQIFPGLRVALALSFIVMFSAEMINARSGLGHLIREAGNSLRFDLMYVSLLTYAIPDHARDRLLRSFDGNFIPWEESHA